MDIKDKVIDIYEGFIENLEDRVNELETSKRMVDERAAASYADYGLGMNLTEDEVIGPRLKQLVEDKKAEIDQDIFAARKAINGLQFNIDDENGVVSSDDETLSDLDQTQQVSVQTQQVSVDAEAETEEPVKKVYSRTKVKDIDIDELVDDVNAMIDRDTTPPWIKASFGPEALSNPSFKSYHDVFKNVRPKPNQELFKVTTKTLIFMFWMNSSGYKTIEIAAYTCLSEENIRTLLKGNFRDYKSCFANNHHLPTCRKYRQGILKDFPYIPGSMVTPKEKSVTLKLRPYRKSSTTGLTVDI